MACASSNGRGRYPRTSISRSMRNMPAPCWIAVVCPTRPLPPTRRCRRRRSPNERSSSPSSCNVSSNPPKAPLLGAEETVSGVAEPREDVTVTVKAAIKRRRDDRYIGEDARNLSDPLRCGNQTDEFDRARSQLLEARDRSHRRVAGRKHRIDQDHVAFGQVVW